MYRERIGPLMLERYSEIRHRNAGGGGLRRNYQRHCYWIRPQMLVKRSLSIITWWMEGCWEVHLNVIITTCPASCSLHPRASLLCLPASCDNALLHQQYNFIKLEPLRWVELFIYYLCLIKLLIDCVDVNVHFFRTRIPHHVISLLFGRENMSFTML